MKASDSPRHPDRRSVLFGLRTSNLELRRVVPLPHHALKGPLHAVAVLIPLRRFVTQSFLPRCLVALLPFCLSCTGISIAPSCPNELKVGESAPLLANEINPGAIAEYSWVVDPPFVGLVRDPSSPTTVFEAVAEGNARIELTANDGLYQVVSFCTTRVAGFAEPPTDNTNDNSNANDNTSDNTNDNRPDVPDRPGGVRKVRP